MWLKKLLQRKITIKQYELNCIIIVTLLSSIFLLRIWPRFLNDAFEIPRYVYIVLIIIFSIPFIKRIFNR